MEQRSNDAAPKDAQIMLSKEGCVRGTVQKSSNAATKDAITSLKMEEYA
jgi:hypothetical protein